MNRVAWSVIAAAPLLFGACLPANATILTFDVSGGVSDHANIPQDYGDNVAGSPQGGHSYGVGGEGFTPNVVIGYGVVGEDPALWTTGYGDLTNVHFNDTDGDFSFTIRFTADAGFRVAFFGFDLAYFFDGGATIQGFTIRDLATNTVLDSEGETFVPGSGHLDVDYATPLEGADIELVIDLTGLGSVSDDIGIDNIRFGQAAIQQPTPNPEPAALGLLGLGLAGLALARRRRA